MGFFSIPSIQGRPGVYHTYEVLGDIMTLEYVGWGNAHGDGTNATTCQHGPVECYAMRHFACAKYSPSTAASKVVDYVECFDQTLIKTFPAGLPPGTVNETFASTVLEDCAKSAGYIWTSVHSCATSEAGDARVAKEAAKTPDHKGVPFVTLDDGPVMYNSATLNLIKEVCKAFTGPKPAACTTEEELVEAATMEPAAAAYANADLSFAA